MIFFQNRTNPKRDILTDLTHRRSAVLGIKLNWAKTIPQRFSGVDPSLDVGLTQGLTIVFRIGIYHDIQLRPNQTGGMGLFGNPLFWA